MSAQLDSSNPMPLVITLKYGRGNQTPTGFIILERIRYTNPKDRVRISMATRKVPSVFKRPETLSGKQCTPRQSLSCLQQTSCTCTATSTRQPPPTQVPRQGSLQLWAHGVEVGSVLFAMANLVLNTEEATPPHRQCLPNK